MIGNEFPQDRLNSQQFRAAFAMHHVIGGGASDGQMPHDYRAIRITRGISGALHGTMPLNESRNHVH